MRNLSPAEKFLSFFDESVSSSVLRERFKKGLVHVIFRHKMSGKVMKRLEKSLSMLPEEEFPAKLQIGNRIQVPVLIRWKYRLDPGDVLRVRLWSRRTLSGESFYARLGKDGRFTVPKIVVEELEAKPGTMLKCTLYFETAEEE